MACFLKSRHSFSAATPLPQHSHQGVRILAGFASSKLGHLAVIESAMNFSVCSVICTMLQTQIWGHPRFGFVLAVRSARHQSTAVNAFWFKKCIQKLMVMMSLVSPSTLALKCIGTLHNIVLCCCATRADADPSYKPYNKEVDDITWWKHSCSDNSCMILYFYVCTASKYVYTNLFGKGQAPDFIKLWGEAALSGCVYFCLWPSMSHGYCRWKAPLHGDGFQGAHLFASHLIQW